MKKLIFLLFTTTFIVISFLSIKQYEYLQFQVFNAQEDEWNIIIDEGNPLQSKSENFETLLRTAEQANSNIQRVSYEKDHQNEDKIVYYVALNHPAAYFQDIALHSGEYLTNASNPNEFLSTVQTNDTNQIGVLEIFHSFDPIEIRPMLAAQKTKDIKGTYTIDDEDNAEEFKRIALTNGLAVRISKDQSQTFLTEYPYQDMIFKGSFILCLLIAIAMLYDVVNNYKAIAVRAMFGQSFWEIGNYLFKKYAKIFLGSLAASIVGLLLFLYIYNDHQQLEEFLMFWLRTLVPFILVVMGIFVLTWIGTTRIHITQMIKNKKPIKMLFYLNIVVRFVIAIFLVAGLQQGISTYIGLKATVDKQDKWALLNEYSNLGIIASHDPDLFNFPNTEEEEKQFTNLYNELEADGAIYISPSAYYLSHSSNIPLDSNPWGMDGKKVEINENYLEINPIMDTNGEVIELQSTSNGITVLSPIKYKKYEANIKHTIAKDYDNLYGKKLNQHDVNIRYVSNNQSYFSYSTSMAKKNDYEILDPIAVVVNRNFETRYLVNTISRGYGYYTKNSGSTTPFASTLETLRDNELDDIWQPISVAYSNVELKIANEKESLQLATIYSILLLFLAAVLLFFSSIYYLELNKKPLAIQWIFGYNFLEKHYLVYLGTLVFWNLTFMVCYFISSNTLLLAQTTVSLAIFDLILLSIILITNEQKVTKQLLIEN